MNRKDDIERVTDEPELYVEPAPMTRRDTVGVVAAITALAVIGALGYVWLNPDLGWKQLADRDSGDTTVVVRTDSESPAELPVASSKVDASCPYCGMNASRSAGAVQASWSDGTQLMFDSWDCALRYGLDRKLNLTGALAMKYSDPLPETPVWLPAEEAVFLYDTGHIAGAMPPYTAAFSSHQDALSAEAELGGSHVDMDALLAKWNFAAYTPVAPGASTASVAPDSTDSSRGDVLREATVHTDDTSCPYCGMFSEKSHSHAIVQWSDGSHTHHDSWDCVFGHERDAKLMLDQATVLSHGSAGSETRWLDAFSAQYLYGTSDIPGSMPPYVAAFPDSKAAAAAAKELGGEVLDFAGLRKKWSR